MNENRTYNTFKIIRAAQVWLLVGIISIFHSWESHGQCYTTEGQTIQFSSTGENNNPPYVTMHVLTTLKDEILEISETNSFSGQTAGVYKIYGVNYSDDTGLTGLEVGSSVQGVDGMCFEISQPLIITVCPGPSFPCQTFDGSYTFGEMSGNPGCQTAYVLTNVTGMIELVSMTSEFMNIPIGEFLVYPVNVASINDIIVGSNIFLLSGPCFSFIEIPFWIKSCPPCTIFLGDDTEICGGQSILISASGSGNSTFLWSTGQTSMGIVVQPNVTTDYSVTVTNSQGCVASDTIRILIGQPPVIEITGQDTICSGQLTTLSVNTSGIFAWSNGATTPSIDVSPVVNTTYTVTVTNFSGCRNTKSITVVVEDCSLCNIFNCNVGCTSCQNFISFNYSGENQTLTTQFILTNASGEILQISDGSNFTNLSAGLYFVFGINYDENQDFDPILVGGSYFDIQGACLDISEPYIVQLCNAPVAEITGNNILCAGQPSVLTANGGTSYLWSTGEITAEIEVSPLVTTTYSVTVTSNGNCTDVASFEVTVNGCVSIGDFVWQDLDADGIQDVGEPGLGNVLVRLLDENNVQIAFTLSAANGSFGFANVEPGIYSLKFETPFGFLRTSAKVGADDNVDSDADETTGLVGPFVVQENVSIDFLDAGYYKYAQIGDLVFEDRNQNGIQDIGEPGLANVSVEISGINAKGDNVFLTTNTNSFGLFNFMQLIPGTYDITFFLPDERYRFSPQNQGGDISKDSNPDEVTGVVSDVNVISGQLQSTIDAGMFLCSYVGDFVWLDYGTSPNRQDALDVGLNGVSILIYDINNPLTPYAEVSTGPHPDTQSPGYYQFEVCRTGNYKIKANIDDAIYQFVTPNQGTNDNIDSDIVDFANKSTLMFTVNYGVVIDDIDIGLQNVVLPVVVSSFYGHHDPNKMNNHLFWEVHSEVNNSHFELWRKVNNGVVTLVGEVKGRGNDLSTKLYDFVDSDLEESGLYEYYLIQVDFDGRYKNIDKTVLLKVSHSHQTDVLIYPNPSTDVVNVNLTGNQLGQVNIEVFQMNGQLLKKYHFGEANEVKSHQNCRIEMNDWPNGMYIFKIQSGDFTKVARVVKSGQ